MTVASFGSSPSYLGTKHATMSPGLKSDVDAELVDVTGVVAKLVDLDFLALVPVVDLDDVDLTVVDLEGGDLVVECIAADGVRQLLG